MSAIRTAVGRTKPRYDVRRAYGVGQHVDRRVVTHLVVAMNEIIKRATELPEEARGLGVLDRDVEELRLLVATIQRANDEQETSRARAPVSTRDRNIAAGRILAAVDRIVGAGLIEFARSPAKRAEFEALVEGPPRRKQAKPATPPAVA